MASRLQDQLLNCISKLAKNIKVSKEHQPAFTLAEVLITLVIIGVVAAITLPTVINQIQNKDLEIKLKKTNAELNMLSRQFYVDYDRSVTEYVSGSSARMKEFVSKIFPKYLNDGHKYSSCSFSAVDETGSSINTMSYNIYLLKKGNSVPQHTICDNYGLYTAINKVMYYFNDPPGSNTNSGDKNGPVICVDINGRQGPNRYGKDYFLFVFTRDGYVIPMGQEHKDNIPENSTNTGPNFFVRGPEFCRYNAAHRNLLTCSYYALQDKHPTDPNKTYWKDFVNGR